MMAVKGCVIDLQEDRSIHMRQTPPRFIRTNLSRPCQGLFLFFFHGVAVVHEQVARDKQERTDMPPSILLIIATKQNCLSPTVRYPSDSQAESRKPLEKSERLLVERDITFETHHGCSLTLAPPSSRLTLIKFCTLKYQ